MKVRILDNSIRFRVSTLEMKNLSKGEQLESVTHFPAETLYTIISITSSESKITFSKNRISLKLNKQKIQEIHESSEVGFCFEEGDLHVLFEKDFKCLTDRGEDESLLYENPRDSH